MTRFKGLPDPVEFASCFRGGRGCRAVAALQPGTLRPSRRRQAPRSGPRPAPRATTGDLRVGPHEEERYFASTLARPRPCVACAKGKPAHRAG